MRWSLRYVLVGFLITRVGAPLAHSQPAPVVDKVRTRAAKQYVDAGLAAQRTADYDTAITFYQKAYELLPHPVLWFNMAQAHRLAGRAERALELYARYLAADPNSSQAKTARVLVAELEARKAEEMRKIDEARQAEEASRVAEAARKSEAEVARKSEARRQAEESRQARGRQADVREVDPTAAPKHAVDPVPEAGGISPARAPGRALRIYGGGASAIGVASIAVGIAFGLRARSLSSDLSQRGAAYDPAKVDSGRTANRVAIVGLLGGTVALAAGATLYWRGHTRAKKAEGVTLGPMFSDEIAGLAVVGVLP